MPNKPTSNYDPLKNGQPLSGSIKRRNEKLEFKPAENGLVEFDGLVMPEDMSDELKTLNVYIDQNSFEVNLFEM